MRNKCVGVCPMRWHSALLLVCSSAVLLTAGCGFGRYDDTANPQAVAANDGVPGDGPWWPWMCASGSNPSPVSTPIGYTVTGTCGVGGAFAINIDGCSLEGNWDALGLTDITTNIPSSIPEAGGWEVAGTGADGTMWTCDASTPVAGVLTLTCSRGNPAATACVSTLTPVSGL